MIAPASGRRADGGGGVIVSLSSVRGSPGVTSWSLLLASAWPRTSELERVVVEADADGGVLAARYGLGVDPGVAALVAACRRHRGGPVGLELDEVARRIAERVWVVPAPESAERSMPVWGSCMDEVATVAARDDRVWLVDCGRLSRSSPALAFASRCELAVVVCGPGQEDLVSVPSRLANLQRAGAAAAGVLVVGRVDYGLAELRSFFGTALVWQVRSVRDLPALAKLVLTSRRARRTWVWREAVEVAAEIADRLEGAAPRQALTGPGAVSGDG